MLRPKQASHGRRSHPDKLFRFGVALWSVVGLIALTAHWPYAFGALLFATFLHLAALDGSD